jgi:O-antigen ligase
MEILPVIGFIIGLLALISVIIWPQLALGIQVGGIMIAVIVVRYMGFEAGISYTIFGFMLIGLASFVLKQKTQLFKLSRFEIAALALSLLLGISLFYTPTPDYGMFKFQRFTAINFLLIMACRVYGSTRQNMHKTLRIIAWVSVIVLICYVFTWIFFKNILVVEGRFEGGTTSLIFSWTAASSVVFASYLLVGPSMPWTKVFISVLLLFGMAAVVATGSRGPFIGLVFGCMFSFLSKRYLFRSLCVIVLFGLISYISLAYLAPDYARERILSAFQGGAYEKSNRTYLNMLAAEQYLKYPVLGGGAGSFADWRGWGDRRGYNHNMFLEVAGEAGTVGLIIILCLFVFCIRPMLRLRSKKEPMVAASRIIQWLFWLGLVNALTSFDIPEQRALFAAIGFLAAVDRWPEPDEEDMYQNMAPL